jgi:glycosyltransferase involved in cell wall biosynthesis
LQLSTVNMEAGERLAILGGFIKPPPDAPHGAWQASYRLSSAIVATRRFRAVDVFHEGGEAVRGTLTLPEGVGLQDRTSLRKRPGVYSAIYVSNGEQVKYPPHMLRPDDDAAPVICEIGTAHDPRQWSNFFLAAFSGTLRDTDGFIFKASFAEKLFRQVWDEWRGRISDLPFPTATVIPNGIDLEANRRNDRIRAELRSWLGLRPEHVAFLTFSRLASGTKGDYLALVFLWKRVVERWPNAILVLSGRGFERAFLLHLRVAAREAGVANHVVIADNPYEIWKNARECVMSAADVFLHLSTGVEEVSSNSTLEAMAFELPVIASDWAGQPEIVEHGTNGFLIPTYVSEPPVSLQRMMLARQTAFTNTDLGRFVGCDGEAIVAAVGALMDDQQLRREMGSQSRQRAQALFAMERVAARRVAFFEELDSQARHSGAAATAPRDLLDFRSVLWSMGKGPLASDDLLEISGQDGFDFVRAAPATRGAASIDIVESILRQAGSISVGELAVKVKALAGGPEAPAGGEPLASRTWKACHRTLVQLISYGAVRVRHQTATRAAR